MHQNFDFGDLNYRSTSLHYTRINNQKLIHLCDRLVFEFDSHLRDYEIKALSRLSMKYQGRATDRELSMIGDICNRVGIAWGIE